MITSRPEGVRAHYRDGWAYLFVPPHPDYTIEVQEHINGAWSPVTLHSGEYPVHMYSSPDIKTTWRARYTHSNEVGPWVDGRVWSPDGFETNGHSTKEPRPHPPIAPTGPRTITTVVGTGHESSGGDDGPATQAQIEKTWGVALDGHGNLYLCTDSAVRKVSGTDNTITTIAKAVRGSDSVNYPVGITADGHGNLYLPDRDGQVVWKISSDNTITIVAGSKQSGYDGDDKPATQAQLSFPNDVAVDAHGNLYIADYLNNRVRKVSAADNTITTIAGTGSKGADGDDGPATQATLRAPSGVALDGHGNIYIADTDNRRVRKVSAADNTITTIAGTGSKGADGDGGPATQAILRYPVKVAVDGHGNLYIADARDNRIRMVSAADNTITTIAGTGHEGADGDDGPATQAQLNSPWAVAVDGRGALYIADLHNFRVRKVTAPVRLTGELSVTATYALTDEPVANTQVHFTLNGNPDARFPNNTARTDVTTDGHGTATAPRLTAEGDTSTVTIHLTEPDNNTPTAHHPETSH